MDDAGWHGSGRSVEVHSGAEGDSVRRLQVGMAACVSRTVPIAVDTDLREIDAV
jgi:hypothetical protein